VVVRAHVANYFDSLSLGGKYLCGDGWDFASPWSAGRVHYGHGELRSNGSECGPLAVIKICGHSEFLVEDCPYA
jgi:hypothetical protein